MWQLIMRFDLYRCSLVILIIFLFRLMLVIWVLLCVSVLFSRLLLQLMLVIFVFLSVMCLVIYVVCIGLRLCNGCDLLFGFYQWVVSLLKWVIFLGLMLVCEVCMIGIFGLCLECLLFMDGDVLVVVGIGWVVCYDCLCCSEIVGVDQVCIVVFVGEGFGVFQYVFGMQCVEEGVMCNYSGWGYYWMVYQYDQKQGLYVYIVVICLCYCCVWVRIVFMFMFISWCLVSLWWLVIYMLVIWWWLVVQINCEVMWNSGWVFRLFRCMVVRLVCLFILIELILFFRFIVWVVLSVLVCSVEVVLNVVVFCVIVLVRIVVVCILLNMFRLLLDVQLLVVMVRLMLV